MYNKQKPLKFDTVFAGNAQLGGYLVNAVVQAL